jgi:hypothetical protein
MRLEGRMIEWGPTLFTSTSRVIREILELNKAQNATWRIPTVEELKRAEEAGIRDFETDIEYLAIPQSTTLEKQVELWKRGEGRMRAMYVGFFRRVQPGDPEYRSFLDDYYVRLVREVR